MSIDSVRTAVEVYGKEVTARLQPVLGALEGLNELSQRYEIIVVTARNGAKLEYARAWLSRYKETRELKCVGVEAKDSSKVGVCKQEAVTVLIDDDERHASQAALSGIHPILLKNQAPDDFNRKGAVVCRSWKEAVESVKRIVGY